MARPRKSRIICTLPKIRSFEPVLSEPGSADAQLVMGLDEYETIRLIDLLNCTQEECAEQMGVARTTVQAVYETARKKLAAALVEGKRLSIRGGDYTICARSKDCCKKNCGARMTCRKMCGEARVSCADRKPGEGCGEKHSEKCGEKCGELPGKTCSEKHSI